MVGNCNNYKTKVYKIDVLILLMMIINICIITSRNYSNQQIIKKKQRIK